jgi:hypothetical protein
MGLTIPLGLVTSFRTFWAPGSDVKSRKRWKILPRADAPNHFIGQKIDFASFIHEMAPLFRASAWNHKKLKVTLGNRGCLRHVFTLLWSS